MPHHDAAPRPVWPGRFWIYVGAWYATSPAFVIVRIVFSFANRGVERQMRVTRSFVQAVATGQRLRHQRP